MRNKNSSLCAGLQVAGLLFACIQLQAKNFYVGPGGTPAGPGTSAQPYDLATALSGQVGRPGDTFWLMGGDYILGHVDTTVHGASGKSITFRSVAGESVRIDGSLTIFNTSGHLVFRDFELYSSDANRVSSQMDVGFNPTDIRIIPGVACYAPNVSFINLVIHDQTRHGLYLSPVSTNVLVYGCVVYNNGWVSPDNAEGHGLYVQGQGGTRTVAENLVFNNSGANIHVYENEPGRTLRGVVVQGNVAFNAGAIQHVRAYRDWIAGVDSPATYADRIALKDNMGYPPRVPGDMEEVQVGRDSTNGTVIVTGNYMPMGLDLSNWRRATISKNVFASSPSNYVVKLVRTLIPLHAQWDNNTYVYDPSESEFLLDAQPITESEWRAATRFDSHSKIVPGAFQGTKVFLRRNHYERGRANIIVYNWDNLSNVPVNVNSVLPRHWGYELRNAQDFNAAPVLSGVFDGKPLQLPMTNLTVASVNGPQNGPLVTAPPTGPKFNVFVLLSRPNQNQRFQ